MHVITLSCDYLSQKDQLSEEQKSFLDRFQETVIMPNVIENVLKHARVESGLLLDRNNSNR